MVFLIRLKNTPSVQPMAAFLLPVLKEGPIAL